MKLEQTAPVKFRRTARRLTLVRALELARRGFRMRRAAGRSSAAALPAQPLYLTALDARRVEAFQIAHVSFVVAHYGGTYRAWVAWTDGGLVECLGIVQGTSATVTVEAGVCPPWLGAHVAAVARLLYRGPGKSYVKNRTRKASEKP